MKPAKKGLFLSSSVEQRGELEHLLVHALLTQYYRGESKPSAETKKDIFQSEEEETKQIPTTPMTNDSNSSNPKLVHALCSCLWLDYRLREHQQACPCGQKELCLRQLHSRLPFPWSTMNFTFCGPAFSFGWYLPDLKMTPTVVEPSNIEFSLEKGLTTTTTKQEEDQKDQTIKKEKGQVWFPNKKRVEYKSESETETRKVFAEYKDQIKHGLCLQAKPKRKGWIIQLFEEGNEIHHSEYDEHNVLISINHATLTTNLVQSDQSSVYMVHEPSDVGHLYAQVVDDEQWNEWFYLYDGFALLQSYLAKSCEKRQYLVLPSRLQTNEKVVKSNQKVVKSDQKDYIPHGVWETRDSQNGRIVSSKIYSVGKLVATYDFRSSDGVLTCSSLF